MSFDAEKAAHMSAYLLFQAGGTMKHMKLIKLLYLAEREGLRRCGWFMSNDVLFSLPHGLILYDTLNLINRDIDNSETWNQLISERKPDYTVSLERDIELEELDELSIADVEVLEDTWQKFGAKDEFWLSEYMQNPENCPEWENPGKSSKPVSLNTVLISVGFSPEDARGILERMRDYGYIDDSSVPKPKPISLNKLLTSVGFPKLKQKAS